MGRKRDRRRAAACARALAAIAAAWLIVALLTSCTGIGYERIDLPAEPTQFWPSPDQAALWDSTLACAGRYAGRTYDDQLALTVVSFWFLDHSRLTYDDQDAGGTWFADAREMWFAHGYLRDSRVWRHEFIHALQTGEPGFGPHPELAPNGNVHDPALFAACNTVVALGDAIPVLDLPPLAADGVTVVSPVGLLRRTETSRIVQEGWGWAWGGLHRDDSARGAVRVLWGAARWRAAIPPERPTAAALSLRVARDPRLAAVPPLRSHGIFREAAAPELGRDRLLLPGQGLQQTARHAAPARLGLADEVAALGERRRAAEALRPARGEAVRAGRAERRDEAGEAAG